VRFLRVPLRRISIHQFPDGETLASIGQRRTRSDAIIVRRLDNPNLKILQTLFVADALRRSGARKVTLVVPYFPYLRRDKVFHHGQALSAKVFGELIGHRFDRVITIDPHLHRVELWRFEFARSHVSQITRARRRHSIELQPRDLSV